MARDGSPPAGPLGEEGGRGEPSRGVLGQKGSGRLARPEGERHSRAGVRVDDAGRVAGQEELAPRGAARAEVDRFADERRPGLGGEAVEVGREGGALGTEARQEVVEVVVRLLGDGRRRQGAEADPPFLDERQPEVAAPENVEGDEV